MMNQIKTVFNPKLSLVLILALRECEFHTILLGNALVNKYNFSGVYFVHDNVSGPVSMFREQRKGLGNRYKPVMEATNQTFDQNFVNHSDANNISMLLDNLLKDYESQVRPGYGGPPTVITVSFLITSMSSISEKEMTYQMDFYLRQSWQDERLKFDSSLESLSLNIQMLEGIWKPDTYFHNGQEAYTATMTKPNKLLRIFKNGTVLFSTRVTIKAKCPMQLQSYPMDKQSCPLTFGSYAFTNDQVTYVWATSNAILVSRVRLSQFDLVGSPHHSLTVTMRTGDFSALQVNFNLKRHMGYFLIQVYVPCILIVVLSWVSFWINREATADRIGLGITTVLTLSTFVVDASNELPKVHYATALDWFIIICFSFVIASVLEFAGVHYFTKVGSGESLLINGGDSHVNDEWEDIETKSSYGDWNDKLPPSDIFNVEKEASSRKGSMETSEESPSGVPAASGRAGPWAQSNTACCVQFIYCLLGNDTYRMRLRRSTAQGVNSVSKIDKVSRFLFPITFGILNLCYWVRYTANSRSSAD